MVERKGRFATNINGNTLIGEVTKPIHIFSCLSLQYLCINVTNEALNVLKELFSDRFDEIGEGDALRVE